MLRGLTHRGPDGASLSCGLLTPEGSAAIGHARFDAVDRGSQPVQGAGILVIDGELSGPEGPMDATALLKALDLAWPEPETVLDALDGPYAMAYWRGQDVILARDPLGVRPLWYSLCTGLAFASERQALEAVELTHPLPLEPRSLLRYHVPSDRPDLVTRDVPWLAPDNDPLAKGHPPAERLISLLTDSVAKRLAHRPPGPVGVLLSGGVDSTVVARLLMDAGADVRGYVAVLDEPGLKEAADLEGAQRAADHLGIPLHVERATVGGVEALLPRLVPRVGHDALVGVALALHLGFTAAHRDGVRVVFAGQGPDELFGGYARYRTVQDLAGACRRDVLDLWRRDTLRDDLVAAGCSIALRTPFLDTEVVRFALSLPDPLLRDGDVNKLVLRQAASILGLPKELALRPKRAAQYGSRLDHAIARLAKLAGVPRDEYLAQFVEGGQVH